MTKDPIVREVRTAREKLFDACHGSLDEYLNHLKDQEQQDRPRVVSQKIVRGTHKVGSATRKRPNAAHDAAST